ncbi:folate transporter 1, chloroplastic-like [Miscanthus floridulus]|uniref:folate transporter 1, chloroplastic-like n=1 Tax=Miscanthus floridulus TaxID=154761 RepID=UPI00345923D1
MPPGTSPVAAEAEAWTWENAAAGAVAGFATVAALHPLDVVRTRFQVSGGRGWSEVPPYRNTAHAVYTITRSEGPRGLYAGFYPAVLGSTVSWGLYFFFYNRAKQRYLQRKGDQLHPVHHLISAAEAGALVSMFTNPIWLVKTRLQLQTPKHHTSQYSGFSDALRTILREEGFLALYRGIGPGLLLVTHGAIQFTAYEELRKAMILFKSTHSRTDNRGGEESLLNSIDFAVLGAGSKVAAILLTYPYQVIRARLQQRPGTDGTPKYSNSWHVVKETARYEGVRGFYRGITSNLLKNLPAASLTFVVYENVIKLFKATKEKT